MKNAKNQRQGFTLIELLTVISIILILAGILVPAVGAVRDTARKAAASSNARQIALAYNNFSQGGSRPRNITSGGSGSFEAGTSIENYAGILARFGGLNSGEVWYIQSDPALSAQINAVSQIKTVVDDPNTWAVGESTNLTVDPVSWNAACNLPVSGDQSTMPLIWTRGISETASTWDTDSPWQGEGGHIAFLDAHVEFLEDLTDAMANSDGTGSGSSLDDAWPSAANVAVAD